jgi:hypothetical protein
MRQRVVGFFRPLQFDWRRVEGLRICAFAFSVMIASAQHSAAQQNQSAPPIPATEAQPKQATAQPATPAPVAAPAPKATKSQAELEADFAKMLSGATLAGSFTSTGGGRDPSRLSSDKYSLGDVKKLGGNIWLIHARMQYGGNDYTVPLPLPIQWAGDTPMIVVDEVTIPGHGTFTARVAAPPMRRWKRRRNGPPIMQKKSSRF